MQNSSTRGLGLFEGIVVVWEVPRVLCLNKGFTILFPCQLLGDLPRRLVRGVIARGVRRGTSSASKCMQCGIVGVCLP